MAEEEGEEAVLEEMEALVTTSTKGIDALEFRVMLGGPQDGCNAYLQISAGAGGVDSCDWAGMLLRMFTRWAESKGHEANLIDRVEETEGGIRSATLYVKGSFAFGHLKAELGVHRLVRISPFDSQARRHTAFASVDVSPEVEDDLEAVAGPDQDRAPDPVGFVQGDQAREDLFLAPDCQLQLRRGRQPVVGS